MNAYEYRMGQFELAGGDIELDLYPAPTYLPSLDGMYAANGAPAFESRERETKDEMYARWGIK